MVSSLIAKGQPWTDPDFPPQQISLYDTRYDLLSASEASFYDSLEWRRASEIYKNATMLKGKKLDVKDFKQGQKQHEYFLAYLRQMPGIQHRLLKVLVTQQVNKAGIYRVKFFVNGLRTSVIVDDFIPVCPQTRMPVFCSSEKGLLWAIIIEKAWAKLNGSYFRATTRSISLLGIHLSGVPADMIPHNSIKTFVGGCWQTDLGKMDECWHRLEGSFQRNYSITAVAKNQAQICEEQGILCGKDYTVKGVTHLQKDSGSGIRLVRLKNNYSNKEWTSDFSRESSKWTQREQEEYYSGLPEGEFYIQFSDYLTCFE